MTVRRIILAIGTLGVSLLYFPLNRPWGQLHNLALPIDRHIPEVAIFVIPYLLTFSLMIVGGGAWLFFRRPVLFDQLCWSITITNIIAFTVYLTFQTVVPREFVSNPDFFEKILNWVRDTDRMYSGFPSGHTYLTTIFTWYVWRGLSRAWRPWLLVNAAAIIAATLLLRQHYLLDPIGGLLVGLGVCWIVGKKIQS